MEPSKGKLDRWNELEIALGHEMRWDLGTFKLVVFRQEGEWLLAHQQAADKRSNSIGEG
jgi:hypothetical protein